MPAGCPAREMNPRDYSNSGIYDEEIIYITDKHEHEKDKGYSCCCKNQLGKEPHRLGAFENCIPQQWFNQEVFMN